MTNLGHAAWQHVVNCIEAIQLFGFPYFQYIPQGTAEGIEGGSQYYYYNAGAKGLYRAVGEEEAEVLPDH